MSKLTFEWVGDIRYTYPYLCVYFSEDLPLGNPFMDIGVTDEKELRFTFYRHEEDVVLSVQQWHKIMQEAELFMPKALATED